MVAYQAWVIQPSSLHPLRITHYALRITHYALRITHYALRITHYALHATLITASATPMILSTPTKFCAPGPTTSSGTGLRVCVGAAMLSTLPWSLESTSE